MTKHYTDEHEWIEVDGDVGAVGITKFASDALGEVAYAEPPEVGMTVSKGDEMGVVENNKAASDIYAPVSGEVVARNDKLDDPDQLNLHSDDPEGEGWFCKIKLSDASELDGLMDAAAYKAFCEAQ